MATGITACLTQSREYVSIRVVPGAQIERGIANLNPVADDGAAVWETALGS